MSISSKVIVAAAGATILVSITPQVYAEENRASDSSGTSQEIRRLRTQIKEDRCQVATERIDFVTNHFQNNKELHVQNYKKMVEVYQHLIERLKTQGYDTTKLEADAKVLNEKIVTFGQAYDIWITQLTVARKLNCGDSQGEFKTEMAKARELAVKMQEAANAVHVYFRTVIRPDIQALRQQKKADQ